MLADAPTVLVSLEDHELGVRPFSHPAIETIVIVRRPQNLFASRIKKSSDTHLLSYSLDNPELLGRSVRLWKEHARAALASSNPAGRLVQPEEVAEAVAFLCQRGASAMTGQAIAVACGEV